MIICKWDRNMLTAKKKLHRKSCKKEIIGNRPKWKAAHVQWYDRIDSLIIRIACVVWW